MATQFNVAGTIHTNFADAAYRALYYYDPPRMIMEYAEELDQEGNLEGLTLVHAYAFDSYSAAWHIVPQDTD